MRTNRGFHILIEQGSPAFGFGDCCIDVSHPRDAKAHPTRPYVMRPGTQYEHLMLPVR
jgi:hypothetical protein